MKIARILLKTVIIILGLAAASVFGLYLWLGTEAGAGAVFGLLVRLAASEGLALTAGSLEVGLPRRLKVMDLRIVDPREFSFTAEALEIELEPAALLTGLVHVPRVSLTGPTLVLPPPTDQEGEARLEALPPEALPPEALPPEALPLPPWPLRLDKLVVTGGRLELDGPEELNLTASLAWEPEAGLTVNDLNLTGTHWTWPEGGEFLGETWLARGDLALDSSSVAFRVERFESGALGLSGQGTWRPGRLDLEELDIQAGGLSLAGGLSIDLTSEEPGLSGRLTGEFPAAWPGWELRGGPARLVLDLARDQGQKADLTAELDHLALDSSTRLRLSKNKLRLSADDLFGRQDLKLALDLGPGRAADLAWTKGEIRAETRGGQGTWRLGAGGGDFNLAAGGGFDLDRSTAEVARLELRAGPTGLNLAAPVAVSWAEGLKISPIKAKILPAGELTLAARLDADEAHLKAEIKNLPYRFLGLFTQADLPEGHIQSLTLDLDRHGLDRRGQSYAGKFNLKTSLAPGALGRLTPALDLSGRLERRGRFNEDQALVAEGTLTGGPGWPAAGQVTFSLPLTQGRDGAPPRPDFQGPLTGRLDFSGPLEPLWRLADLHDRALTGQARVGLDLSGSLGRPDLAGSLWLTGGRYEDRVLGLWLRDLDLSAETRGSMGPIRVALTGRDLGRGELNLTGEISDLASPVLKAEGSLRSLKPFRRDDLSLTLSGPLALSGPPDRLSITSDLTLEEGELDLNLITGAGSIATLPLSDPEAPDGGALHEGSLHLDLKVNAPGRFQVTGYGLESEWRGWLRAQVPPGQDLALTGELRPVRGWYEPPVFNRQFNFESGQVTFTGDPIPFLDLELTNQSPELTAVIKINGPARQPRISLTSRPPLNQDEVAGRLLFGKSPSSLSRLEAVQLAAMLRDLTSFGGDSLNPLKTVRRSLGLDVLRLGGSSGPHERQVSDLSGSLAGDLNTRTGERPDNEAVSIEAGKYISDNIYMGVEHGGDGPAVRLEVELAPSISLEARSSSESSQVGLGWKKDY